MRTNFLAVARTAMSSPILSSESGVMRERTRSFLSFMWRTRSWWGRGPQLTPTTSDRLSPRISFPLRGSSLYSCDSDKMRNRSLVLLNRFTFRIWGGGGDEGNRSKCVNYNPF